MSRTRFDIAVTPENLWFLERYFSVFDCFDLFPLDAISGDTEHGVPLHFRTDLDFTIETDIDRSKMQLRNRSKAHGWMRFTTGHQIQPGDHIVIEKVGDRTYSLTLSRQTA